MAAGLGFKTFTTGEVLSAGDTNGYLMQGVLVFASAAARDAAITSPQEGQFAYLKDTNVTTYYTGSAWTNLVVASGITNAQSFVATAQSTTSVTYAALATAQSVTLTTGTKVLVLLSMSAFSDNNTNNPRSFMSVAVSGATTTAASDANSVMSRCLQASVLNGRVGVSLFMTCTAGSNTFTAQFRQPDYTGTFSDRQMIVIDLGS